MGRKASVSLVDLLFVGISTQQHATLALWPTTFTTLHQTVSIPGPLLFGWFFFELFCLKGLLSNIFSQPPIQTNETKINLGENPIFFGGVLTSFLGGRFLSTTPRIRRSPAGRPDRCWWEAAWTLRRWVGRLALLGAANVGSKDMARKKPR